MIATSYSFRFATGRPAKIVPILKEKGFSVAPIADTTAFGWYQWDVAAKEAGLRPVFGARINVCPSLNAKKPTTDLFTFIAKESIEPINRMLNRATSQFRYTPLLHTSDLAQYDVYKIAGHRARLEDLDPNDEDLFIGLSVASAKGYVIEAAKRGFKFCAAQENRYPLPSQRYDYELACGRGANLQTYSQHILSDNEWKEAIRAKGLPDCEYLISEALQHREEIFVGSTAELPRGKLVAANVTKDLETLCREGAAKLAINLESQVYRDRLAMELKVIRDKGIEDYFLIVGSLMIWARSNFLCGPGRGSSAGSLVCFLLEITRVDPVKEGLLFARFLDPERADSADIDLDLSATYRDSAIEWLKEQYGADRVAKLGAVGTYQTKNAANEASKALGISKFEILPVVAAVTKYAANDARNEGALKEALETTSAGQRLIAKHPEFEAAGRLGGLPVNASTHAAGVLLTHDPIYKFTAVDARTNTAQVDGVEAEKRGALKIDLLSLSALSVFEETLQLAGLPLDYLDKIPLDDQKTFDAVNEGKFVGTFQFSGRAVQNLTKEVTVTCLNDLVTLSALGRPGPISSGAAASWINRKNGKEEITYLNPSLEPYLKPYLGTLVMQETFMAIAHDIVGLSWGQVNKMRKAISKSMGAEGLREYEESFKAGLAKAGWLEEQANRFWRDIVGWGSYGFCAAHAYSYGLMSYYSFYLKANHGLEFAAASLSFEDDSEKQLLMLRELAREGIRYVPVDAEQSTDKWRVGYRDGGKILIGPLSSVQGLGPKMQNAILSARARGESLPDRAAKLLAKAETKIDTLWPIKDAIANIDLAAKGIVTKPIPIDQYEATEEWEEDRVVVGVVTICKERDENEPARIEDRIANGREGKMTGKTAYLEMRVSDDSGTLLCKVGRNDFEQLGRQLVDKIKEGKTLVACKGTCPPGIGMLLVKQARILGSL